MTVADFIRVTAGKVRDMSDEELVEALFKFEGEAAEIGLVKKEDRFQTKEELLEWIRLTVNLEGDQ